MIEILPSIIALEQSELDALISKVVNIANVLQLDIMDGDFVPSHSLDFSAKFPKARYEAHLMVSDPIKWINDIHSVSETIIVHFESLDHPDKAIDLIKEKNRRAGLAINPQTNIDLLIPYLKRLDEVLIMTVEPGFYGAKFLPEMLEKVRIIRNLTPDIDIEVDGGISDQTIAAAAKAGANFFISGSYLVKSENIKERYNILRKIASENHE